MYEYEFTNKRDVIRFCRMLRCIFIIPIVSGYKVSIYKPEALKNPEEKKRFADRFYLEIMKKR